jgi:hypothetical protein
VKFAALALVLAADVGPPRPAQVAAGDLVLGDSGDGFCVVSRGVSRPQMGQRHEVRREGRLVGTVLLTERLALANELRLTIWRALPADVTRAEDLQDGDAVVPLR